MNEQVKNNIMEYKQKYLQKLTDAQVPEKLEKQLEEMDWSCLELIHQKKQQRGTFAPLQATELSEIRKKEDLYRKDYTSEAAFKRGLASYIEFYNTQRPHRTLKNLTPCQVEDAFMSDKS